MTFPFTGHRTLNSKPWIFFDKANEKSRSGARKPLINFDNQVESIEVCPGNHLKCEGQKLTFHFACIFSGNKQLDELKN